MTSELSIESEVLDDDILVVKLRGEFDTSKAEQFEQEIQQRLEPGYTNVIIDCTFLSYVSSRGMGALLTLQARLRKHGGTIKLAGIHGLAADAVRLTRLDKILDIYDDLEFARESFRK